MAAETAEPVAAAVSTDDAEQLTSESVREWLNAHHYRKQIKLLDQFQHELRFGIQLDANYSTVIDPRWAMVHKTVNLIRHMVGSTSWKTAAELLSLLKGISKELKMAAGSTEPAIPNIVRRVMAAVREEAQREAQETETPPQQQQKNDPSRLSLQSMLWALPQHVKSSSRSVGQRVSIHERQESLASEADADQATVYPPIYYQRAPSNLKQTILEAIQEILSDLEDTHRSINEQVTHHIHAGEVLLTTGNSKTIELFLETAMTKHPNLTVIVCGSKQDKSYPNLKGEIIIYMELAAVFAIMPRVHKVLLPAHAVLANGGLVSTNGSNLVAMAASHYSVPVVCVTGTYKLCPMFPHEGQDTLQDWTRPRVDVPETVESIQPVRDYIEPDYISLFITNVGAFRPSFIYRLLAEHYHSDDWET